MSGLDRAGAAAGAEALAASFLSAIWPSQGRYFIATPLPKGGYKHSACGTVAEAARLAIQLDSQGETVYFATAAFRAPFVDTPQANGKTKRQYRVRPNVRALRSLFLDVDVKPGQANAYATLEEAVEALDNFFAVVGLPEPIVVRSGGGLHVYLPFATEVALADWQPAADKLKALCAKLGFRADPSRTSDATSVLRPVGTTHRKDPANPRPVEQLLAAAAVPFERICEILDRACTSQGVSVSFRRGEPEHDRVNDQFAVQQNFPPASAHLIADKCAQLRRMRDTKGCVPEPHWYASIGLMIHAVEGEDLIHDWSSGYSGYSRSETDNKVRQAREKFTGPTLCSRFEEWNPGGCDGCPFKGKISSPAQLGTEVKSAPSPVVQVQPTGEASPAPTTRAPVPVIHLLEELNNQYAWVEKQKQIYRFQYRDFIEPDKFKLALANRPPVFIGFGNEDPKATPLATAWLKWHGRREHLDIVYEPGEDPIFKNQINLWTGWGCDQVEGDVGPWQELLDEAFGKDTPERNWFEQWAAYPIQYPGTKLFTATLLWSIQEGIGKSVIGQTLGKLYGKNAGEITDNDLDKPFNAWVKGKQFILGEEITSSDRRAAMNRLKHLITGSVIPFNEKYQPEIDLRNTINFMFTSNSPDALHIGLNDRRICVVEFAGKKLPKDFFDNFIRWRDERGGLDALMHHLLHLPLGGFSPTAEAPRTRAKDEMMDATRSDLERWIYDRFLDPMAPIACEVVYTGDLVEQYLREKFKPVTDTAVGRALTKLGSGAWCRVTLPEKGRCKLRSIRRHPFWNAADDAAWAREYEKGRAKPGAIQARPPSATVPQSRHDLH